MAINPTIALHEGDDLYKYFTDKVANAPDDNLVIIARSDKNRKGDNFPAFFEKHGIYFYVAYEMEGALAFIGNPTDDQIAKAKQNMIDRTRLGSIFKLISDWDTVKTVDSWEYDEGDPMVIVTIDTRCNGAGILYCSEIFHKLYSKIGDFYILPSSIHELIILKKVNGVGANNMNGLVREVNNDAVSDYEYLADNAFSYLDWA